MKLKSWFRATGVVGILLLDLLPIGCGNINTSSSTPANIPLSSPANNAPAPVSPSAPSFVYVSSLGDNSVSGFSVDPTTGSLTPVPQSPFPISAAPTAVAADAKGNFLLLALQTGIEVLKIDRKTGALSAVVGSPFSCAGQPSSILVFGQFVYAGSATTGEISAYSLDSGTGSLSSLPGSPFVGPVKHVQSLALENWSLTYSFLDAGGEGIENFKIGATGALFFQTVANDNVTALASPHGSPLLYAVEQDGVHGFIENYKDGPLESPVPASPYSLGDTKPNGIAFDASMAGLTYGVVPGSNRVATFVLIVSTPIGHLTRDEDLENGPGPYTVAADPIAGFTYVVNQSSSTIMGYQIIPCHGALCDSPLNIKHVIGPYSTGTNPGPSIVVP